MATWPLVKRGKNGERLYSLNCKGCHSNDGKAGTGPSFLNKYGSMEELQGGGSIKVNDDYVLRSIYEPQADIVKGYGPRSQMPSFQGKLNEKQIGWIIDYMMRISNKAPKKPAKPKAGEDKGNADKKTDEKKTGEKTKEKTSDK